LKTEPFVNKVPENQCLSFAIKNLLKFFDEQVSFRAIAARRVEVANLTQLVDQREDVGNCNGIAFFV
jgi:hypothetical protein